MWATARFVVKVRSQSLFMLPSSSGKVIYLDVLHRTAVDLNRPMPFLLHSTVNRTGETSLVRCRWQGFSLFVCPR